MEGTIWHGAPFENSGCRDGGGRIRRGRFSVQVRRAHAAVTLRCELTREGRCKLGRSLEYSDILSWPHSSHEPDAADEVSLEIAPCAPGGGERSAAAWAFQPPRSDCISAVFARRQQVALRYALMMHGQERQVRRCLTCKR